MKRPNLSVFAAALLASAAIVSPAHIASAREIAVIVKTVNSTFWQNVQKGAQARLYPATVRGKDLLADERSLRPWVAGTRPRTLGLSVDRQFQQEDVLIDVEHASLVAGILEGCGQQGDAGGRVLRVPRGAEDQGGQHCASSAILGIFSA